MRKPILPHDAFILVGDGRKALFLRNDGDEQYARFVTERAFVDDNPPTRDQGSDRPGRAFACAGFPRRSAVETTDWRALEEHRFAERVARALERVARERKAPALAIAAPPRTLADLRAALAPDVRAKVVLEINKDLTRVPVWAIEKHVAEALAGAR
ncbi:protein required for attachment to host cells [Roseiarcus fermentans]|uniref:Protein required for attachment to host cells n=1 Tax=Roseiarcus fermentans TaxID=1473586 RepID=A0A366FDV5_9HYPH|nr:host attachment family protein [Roseiarcus fermentans]RBP11939.1 protein required for attachment to host cells [Roseiarcus fermentans]